MTGAPECGDDLREELERLRERARRLESLAALAVGIAHEINNPIGGILLAAEAALRKPQDSREARESLETVIGLAQRCRAIVRNVRRFARSQSVPMAHGDLNGAVGRAAARFAASAQERGCVLETRLEAGLPPMRLVEGGIEQVVENLVANAVEAGARRVGIRTFPRGGAIVLEVEDDGAGIDPERIPQVFEAFFTTRRDEGGTGLGLAIVRGIVVGHGGTISAESQPGAGTVFTATFPAASAGGEGSDGRADPSRL